MVVVAPVAVVVPVVLGAAVVVAGADVDVWVVVTGAAVVACAAADKGAPMTPSVAARTKEPKFNVR
jgi:hypothetical protein